jgi:3-hydroxyacyl-CoA dehydrogenase
MDSEINVNLNYTDKGTYYQVEYRYGNKRMRDMVTNDVFDSVDVYSSYEEALDWAKHRKKFMEEHVFSKDKEKDTDWGKYDKDKFKIVILKKTLDTKIKKVIGLYE